MKKTWHEGLWYCKDKKEKISREKKIHEGLKKTWHYGTVKIKKNRFQAGFDINFLTNLSIRASANLFYLPETVNY